MAPSDGIAVKDLAGQPVHGGDGDPTLWPAVGTAIVLLLIVQAGFLVKSGAPVLNGALIDPDGYMRLARVEQLWLDGAWFESLFSRIGPPEGLALHWTRPFDLLLLGGALIASPLLGFKAALFWWGAFFGPLLQVGAVIALVWAAAPLLRKSWLCLLPFLFVAQPAVFASFAAGRPDHHGVQILLLILLIGFTLRLILDPARIRVALWAGLVAALDIWISIEATIPVALSIAALGLVWLSGERRVLRALVMLGGTLWLALLAAVFAERGSGALSEIEFDRVSVAHLIPFALNWVFWLAMRWLEQRGVLDRGAPARAAAASIGSAAVLAALWRLQPGLFANPMAGGDVLYMTKHLAHIEELKPLVDLSDTAESAWLEIAAKPILWLGTALLALPWLLHRLGATGGAERWAWVYLGLGVVAFLPLAVHQIRWTFYPEILLLIPYAAFAGSVVDRLARGLSEAMVGLLRPLLMALLCVWPFMPTAAVQEEPQTGSGVSNAVSCPIRDLAPLLNDPAGLGAQPRTVLALIDFGPELLYRTRHSVLSVPNHRYQPGFATSYRIMSASDFAQAERDLKAARIDLILICPGSAESWFYDTEGSERTLNEALRDGDVPTFLRPLALPAPLSEHFKLFQVRATDD